VTALTPPSEVAELRRRIAELEARLSEEPRRASDVEERSTPEFPSAPPETDRSPIEWPEADQLALAEDFHRLWYDHGDRTWRDTRWLGSVVHKLPLDLWAYQELIWRVRPTLLVECGTYFGGSAHYFASIFDLIGEGQVISIDIDPAGPLPEHPRIRYLRGSSTDDRILEQVRAEIGPSSRVMVILDSDHSEAHVRQELERYAPLVSVGSYLIVEDSNVNGHPVLPGHGPGPWEALTAFFAGRTDFEQDPWGEHYLFSFATDGFWRRISPS
jgi:cephalosporin hydroxylase